MFHSGFDPFQWGLWYLDTLMREGEVLAGCGTVVWFVSSGSSIQFHMIGKERSCLDVSLCLLHLVPTLLLMPGPHGNSTRYAAVSRIINISTSPSDLLRSLQLIRYVVTAVPLHLPHLLPAAKPGHPFHPLGKAAPVLM